MKKPSALAGTIRAEIDAGRLPREDHIKLWVGYGRNRPCVACERVILVSQVEHEFQFADGRMISMHVGCSGLYEAERRRRGWSSRTMPDTTAIIAAALVIECPLCLDCIAMKAGVGPATTKLALARLRNVLALQRDETGRCRECGAIGVVFSLN